MSSQDQRIKDYIAQVITLREASAQALSEEELRHIAREVGITDDDILAAEEAARAHFARGERFVAHQRWDDAIVELQQATALAPSKLPPRATLAHAFAQRWQQHGHEPDRQAATALARECIALDPHHQSAYQLLNQLDAPAVTALQPQNEAPSKSKSKGKMFIVLAVLLFFVFDIVVVAFLFPVSDSESEGPPAQHAEPQELLNTSAAAITPSDASTPSAPNAALRVTFPVKVDLPANSPLQLDALLHSELKVFNPAEGHGFYTGILRLKNTSSNQEVITPKLELVFKDAAGENVAVQSITSGLGFQPVPLRPGDTHAARTILKLPTTATHATLIVAPLTTQPAPASYPEPEAVPLRWIVKSPLGDSISVRAREATASHYTRDSYLKVAWIVRNDSAQPIQQLKGRVVMLGKEDAPSQSHDMFLVSTMEAPLMAGESRLVVRTFKTSADHTGYRLEMTELRPFDTL